MSIQIVGDVDKNRIFCAGSGTKLLTVYLFLLVLSKKYELKNILDDENFLNVVAKNPQAKEFLMIFQKIIGGKFTIRDLCTHYTGLPYTFDVSEKELIRVEQGIPFRHHSILDEETFLDMCRNNITPVYSNRCKFHYSELSIIFLGYFLEKAYDIQFESLYQEYIIDKFKLKNSFFSRKIIASAYRQDLTDLYDYPAAGIADHGFFCYSNSFYTTLNDMKIVIEHLLEEPIFKDMTDIDHARAASNRLMDGLSIEIRRVKDDIIYGYEGFSFSGCNLWAYSTKQKQGYITIDNSEEGIYDIIYGGQFGYHDFDKVPDHSQKIYQDFIKRYNFNVPEKNIPIEYQGNYQRVKINEKNLTTIFIAANNYIVIRNPELIKYEIMYVNNNYRIKCKDNVHGVKVGFCKTVNNNYMYFDGNLYKKFP